MSPSRARSSDSRSSARRPGSFRSSRSDSTTRSPASGASGRPSPPARKPSAGSGWPISRNAPVHTWERATKWNAVRPLLADEAETEIGRELAATVEPLTEPSEVCTELQLTRQARLARATSGSLPLDGFPDIRPALDHCRTIGSVLDGADLVRLVPALLAIPRLEAYGTSVEAVAPEVTAIIASLPRFHELADRLGRSLDAAGAVTDDASPRSRHLRREIREGRRRVARGLERPSPTPGADTILP